MNALKAQPILRRVDHAGRHQYGIVDAAAFLDQQRLALHQQHVVVLARLQDARGLVDQRLQHEVVAFCGDEGLVVGRHADVADEMLDIARREHLGMSDRVGAILQHAHAFARHQRERQVGVGVVAGDEPIDAVLGEELGPALDLAAVEHRGIFEVEFLDQKAQLGELGAIKLCGRREGLGIGHHSPISSR